MVREFGLPVVAKTVQGDFEEQHLIELQDSQLLELALKLGLISEDGFFFLDQCRETRNNFSAAHPTIEHQILPMVILVTVKHILNIGPNPGLL